MQCPDDSNPQNKGGHLPECKNEKEFIEANKTSTSKLFLADEGELFLSDEEGKETGVFTIQTNTSSADLLVEFYTKMQTDWAILVGFPKNPD